VCVLGSGSLGEYRLGADLRACDSRYGYLLGGGGCRLGLGSPFVGHFGGTQRSSLSWKCVLGS